MDETDGLILRPRNFSDDIDLLPENCEYRDEGCDLAVSCLKCPFPRCVREERRGKAKRLKKIRASEIATQYADGQQNLREIAAMFKVSERTVKRALKSARGTKRHHRRRNQRRLQDTQNESNKNRD